MGCGYIDDVMTRMRLITVRQEEGEGENEKIKQ
jgi:hypothetical protein